MTADTITKTAATLRQQADELAQALTTLRAQPGYRRWAGAPGTPRTPMSGETLARANEMADRMCELFPPLEQLYRTLDEADAAIVASQGIFGDAAKLQHAEALLAQTPIEKIKAGFEHASKAVEQLDATWDAIKLRCSQAISETSSLRELAPPGDANARHQLDLIAAKLATLRTNAETDPLGASQQFADTVESPLQALRESLEHTGTLRNAVQQAFAAAEKLREEVAAKVQEARLAAAEATEKISGETIPQPPDEYALSALGQWLATLRSKHNDDMQQSLLTGTERWSEKARMLLGEAEKSLSANQNQLRQRRQLRGLLKALRAKAVARGAAEEATLTRLASEADAMLYTRPTPLARAAATVSEYERLLNGR